MSFNRSTFTGHYSAGIQKEFSLAMSISQDSLNYISWFQFST